VKQELIEILCRKSFKYSNEPIYKLVSGKTSCFYINCKPTTLSPRGMYLTGHLIFEAIKNCQADGIGGLTFGADPMAIATAFVSEMQKAPLKAFSIRKEKKNHGISRWIEGDMQTGEKVVILDDVATTGVSTIKAVERAQSEGLQVVKVVILVDRQEGGMENIQQHVSDTIAIINREELLNHYQQR
jgi:orotate phosphoribosyltransferase